MKQPAAASKSSQSNEMDLRHFLFQLEELPSAYPDYHSGINQVRTLVFDTYGSQEYRTVMQAFWDLFYADEAGKWVLWAQARREEVRRSLALRLDDPEDSKFYQRYDNDQDFSPAGAECTAVESPSIEATCYESAKCKVVKYVQQSEIEHLTTPKPFKGVDWEQPLFGSYHCGPKGECSRRDSGVDVREVQVKNPPYSAEEFLAWKDRTAASVVAQPALRQTSQGQDNKERFTSFSDRSDQIKLECPVQSHRGTLCSNYPPASAQQLGTPPPAIPLPSTTYQSQPPGAPRPFSSLPGIADQDVARTSTTDMTCFGIFEKPESEGDPDMTITVTTETHQEVTTDHDLPYTYGVRTTCTGPETPKNRVQGPWDPNIPWPTTLLPGNRPTPVQTTKPKKSRKSRRGKAVAPKPFSGSGELSTPLGGFTEQERSTGGSRIVKQLVAEHSPIASHPASGHRIQTTADPSHHSDKNENNDVADASTSIALIAQVSENQLVGKGKARRVLGLDGEANELIDTASFHSSSPPASSTAPALTMPSINFGPTFLEAFGSWKAPSIGKKEKKLSALPNEEASITLSFVDQRELYSFIEFSATSGCAQFLEDNKDKVHLQTLKNEVKKWTKGTYMVLIDDERVSMPRERVKGFWFPLDAQIRLLEASAPEFFGSSVEGPLRVLSHWKEVLGDMTRKSYCFPDILVMKHLKVWDAFLRLLGPRYYDNHALDRFQSGAIQVILAKADLQQQSEAQKEFLMAGKEREDAEADVLQALGLLKKE